MLKRIIISVLCIMSLSLSAQNASTPKFGHVNAQEILVLMPQFAVAQADMEKLAKEFEAELMKMNEEFERKVTEYKALGNVSEEIKEMRQKEIMDLEQRIGLIRQTAEEQLDNKQKALLAPLVEQVKKAIKEVGDENGFTYIFDLSVPAVVYVSDKSVDITPLMKKKLNIPATATVPAALAPKATVPVK